MVLSNIARSIIKRANELGYFPTDQQATRISQLAAQEYPTRVSGDATAVQKQKLIDALIDEAIPKIMESEHRNEDEQVELWKVQRVVEMRKRLAAKSPEELMRYADEVCTQIILTCADLGVMEWPAELHLADVVDKWLAKSVVARPDDGGKSS